MKVFRTSKKLVACIFLAGLLGQSCEPLGNRGSGVSRRSNSVSDSTDGNPPQPTPSPKPTPSPELSLELQPESGPGLNIASRASDHYQLSVSIGAVLPVATLVSQKSNYSIEAVALEAAVNGQK